MASVKSSMSDSTVASVPERLPFPFEIVRFEFLSGRGRRNRPDFRFIERRNAGFPNGDESLEFIFRENKRFVCLTRPIHNLQKILLPFIRSFGSFFVVSGRQRF